MELAMPCSTSCLLDLINELYVHSGFEQISSVFLDRLFDAIPFSGAAVLPIDPRRYELQAGLSREVEKDALELYLQHFARIDPCLHEMRCPSGLNGAVRLSDAVSIGQRTDAIDSFGQFQVIADFRDALCSVVGLREQPLALIRLHRRRSDPAFSNNERHLLRQLAPHLARALTLGGGLSDQSPSEDNGLLLVGSDRRIIYRNRAASSMLSNLPADSVLSLAERTPICKHRDSRLHRLRILPLRPCSVLSWIEGRDTPLNLARRNDRRDEASSAGPKIVISEPLRRRQAIENRLAHSRLSPREVDVAMCVIRGLSNADIAAKLHIDETTVKDHLRRIYNKLQVPSRTALISRVLGLDVAYVSIPA